MSVQLQGQDGSTLLAVEAATKAARTTLRPIDFAALGSYAAAGVSTTGAGLTAGMTGGSDIFQFRWTDATKLALIIGLTFSATDTLTAFTAGVCTFNVFIGRTWTTDGSGGASLTAVPLRTSMGASVVGAIRLSTSAALTAGTKTNDAQPERSVSQSVTAGIGKAIIDPVDLLLARTKAEHPIVLGQNEGLSIQATVPVTGKWDFAVAIRWAELTAY